MMDSIQHVVQPCRNTLDLFMAAELVSLSSLFFPHDAGQSEGIRATSWKVASELGMSVMPEPLCYCDKTWTSVGRQYRVT